MGQYGNMLLLSNDERKELTRCAQSRTRSGGEVPSENSLIGSQTCF
jgi:hypothetical protein